MVMNLRKEEHKTHKIDMCNGSVFLKMFLFAIPLMASSMMQLLFNAADVVVVGKYAGDNALAAVGSNGSVINLITNLFIGMSIGTNVLTAQYFGGKNIKYLEETVHTSILISIISGIFLTIFGVIVTYPILKLMQAPTEVIDLAALYLRIYFLGMTPTMVYNFGSAILRAVGDTRRPLYFLSFAGVINVSLNLFFVRNLHMGVAGVGVATVISQVVSAVLVVNCLMHEDEGIRLDLKKLAVKKDKLAKILRIGLPAGFQGMIFSLSNVVIQSSINGFGAIAVAGNSAASNVEGFVYMAMNAFYQATISFTSQNYGAKLHKRIYKVLGVGELYVILIGILFGNAVVIFGHTVLGFYSSSPEVIAAGMGRIQVICSVYALCGIMDVLVGALRGIGYSIMPMIVSLVGACGLRLVWLSTVFQIPQYHTLKTVYMSYPISWTITLSVHALCFVFAARRKLR